MSASWVTFGSHLSHKIERRRDGVTQTPLKGGFESHIPIPEPNCVTVTVTRTFGSHCYWLPIVWLIVTLARAGSPDDTVSVSTRLTPIQCELGKLMYAEQWLAENPIYAGWRLKDEKCSAWRQGAA